MLCQFTDDSPKAAHRQTLKEFIPIPDIYSVGRLDLDSEGLLLLTNDNELKHQFCEPQFAHRRTYWVQVENIPDEAALTALRQGILIKDKKTRPAIAQLLTTAPDVKPRNPPIRERKNIPTAWLELTLTEGRNRQVRRMTAAVSCPTLRLIRVAIADKKQTIKLTIDGLAAGQWRELTSTEVKQLQSSLVQSAPRTEPAKRTATKTKNRHKKTANRSSKKRR